MISARRNRMMVVAALIMVTLSACAMPSRVGGTQDGALRESTRSDDRQVHIDLIRGMLAKQQYYAALAHIQDQQRRSGSSRELTLLEAEARRKLGQSAAAEQLYKQLLGTDYDADAEHGLGLLYASRDLGAAVQHLRLAVQRRPTDVVFRNDLGYALMVAGRYREALPELSTAVELDPNDTLGRNNLIVLLLMNKDEARAKQVARDSGVSDEQLAGLRRKALSMAQPRR